MMTQNQIHRTLNEAGALDRIAEILSQEAFDSRSAVGRRVCSEFGFVDGRGELQLASCLQALRMLASTSERITLPPPQGLPPPSAPCRLEGSVPAAGTVPERLGGVQGLAVVAVEGRAQRSIWNTLIADEHPHGMTTFAGCQMRYLAGSAHGYLGAVGFSASALRLAARDRWMAWSGAQRRAHLNRVVCMSRFLIRPGIACANLASHLLGRVLRRLPLDFERRYGYRPWLVETFVGLEHDGASLRAANFLRVGETAGRGRQDRESRHAKPVKSVYMYALQPDWRRRLRVPHVDAAPALEPGAGLDSAAWAGNEFGGAALGDKRLSARLIKSAGLLAAYPGQAITGNAKTDRAAVDGYYRFIEQPAGSEVTVANILAPHRLRSIQRMRAQQTVLCIQDGSDLNFATRPNCDGLSIIGRNQTGAKTLGLHLHATLAVNAQGLPLGVLRCSFDGPPAIAGDRSGEAGKNGKRGASGKMQRWVDGFRDIVAATRDLTRSTRVISVMDREADFFQLFDEQRRLGRVELLVRAKHDRRLQTKGPKLFEKMAKGAPDGEVEVEIAGLTERPKARGKKARLARTKRLAICEIRYRQLLLPSTLAGAEAIPMWGVQIVETQPPAGEEAVQWRLLTSIPVTDLETSVQIVEHYLQRWRVEDFFRVLKSGCRVEYLAFHSADRLQRAIAINCVIAWRIQLMTLIGRQVPASGADLMFTDQELDFLRDYAAEYKLPPPDTLGAAVRLVALLGGHQNRKHDPVPGNQIMWRGQERLSMATLGHRIAGRRNSRIAIVS